MRFACCSCFSPQSKEKQISTVPRPRKSRGLPRGLGKAFGEQQAGLAVWSGLGPQGRASSSRLGQVLVPLPSPLCASGEVYLPGWRNLRTRHPHVIQSRRGTSAHTFPQMSVGLKLSNISFVLVIIYWVCGLAWADFDGFVWLLLFLLRCHQRLLAISDIFFFPPRIWKRYLCITENI